MPGGFGFSNYATQRPTPNAQEVGHALVGQRMGGGMQAPQPGGPMAMFGAAQPMAPMASPSMGDPQDAALRLDGARRMAGGGQIDDTADREDPGVHSANAVNVAVGEALTRMGGGYTTNPDRFKPRENNVRQLQHLGLSEVEAQLLVRSGGV